MLQAGAAIVDITPPPGTHLSGSGMGEHRPARSVLDQLHAKAVVFGAARKKLCVPALELCTITEECTARTHRAKLAPGSLETVVANAVDILGEPFAVA